MAPNPSSQDVEMGSNQPAPQAIDEQTIYGGRTRFELELEFVQCLGSPWFLNHLAAEKFLKQPAFIAYLEYLQYWSRPPYIHYLTHPGPALRNLELLQLENFRREILRPPVAEILVQEGKRVANEWCLSDEPGTSLTPSVYRRF